MSVDFSLLEGDYLRDLLSQPEALENTLQQLQESRELRGLAVRLRGKKFGSVVLTGMGSSFHALNPLLLQLTEAAIPATLVETSELIYYRRRLLQPNSVVVVVSQSGRSAEVVRLLEVNRRRAAMIAVTNTADSPLARGSAFVVLTAAGEEFSVSCKTYVTALLALSFLGDQLCGVPVLRRRKQTHEALGALAHYLARWKDHVEAMVPRLAGVRQLFLAGRGPSLATTGTGALILKESTQFPAEGLSSAAFRHGPFEMVGPETLVIVLAGLAKTQRLNRRLFEDVRSRCGRAEYLGSSKAATGPAFSIPAVSGEMLPILEILPVQMLTLALSAVAGRQPGQFRFATKITSTE